MQKRYLYRFLFIFYILYSANAFANTDIFPIEDVIACHIYVLPTIQGNILTPSAAYYSSPGGTGTRYVEGDTVHGSRILYAFDQDAMGQEEECFFIQIIDHLPDLSQIGNDTACTYYMLPYFVTPSISGFAGYYTMPNAEGVRYQQGDTIFSSVTLYAYDGYESCSVEKEIRVVIHDLPVFEEIPHQYGCHEYTFSSFNGQNVFSDSIYFLVGNQQFHIGDATTHSGVVEAVARNGTCITRKNIQLSVIDEISIDPIADTLGCGRYFLLPEISGLNVTENAKYYQFSSGTGESYLPNERFNGQYNTSLYAFDYIPGSDCSDEEDFYVGSIEESRAYRDFTIKVCKGYKYNIYDLLLARNIETHENIVIPADNQIVLSNQDIFDTDVYPAGEYRFYVIDLGTFPCENDTAIMTVVVTTNCINSDHTVKYCRSPNWPYKFLLSTNVVRDTGFCVGGYFLDENYNNVLFWNENYYLDTSTTIYYIIEDPNGMKDTSTISLIVLEYIQLEFFDGPDTLCKGECRTFKINLPDEELYTMLASWSLPQYTELNPLFIESFDKNDELVICFLNGPNVNISNNPDTLFLTLANAEYIFNVIFLQLESGEQTCWSSPDDISIFTLDDNTFHYLETLCTGGSVIFEGEQFNEQRPRGEILFDVPAVNGCDSFIYVNLSFYQPAIKTIREEICDIDSVIINCIAYTSEFSRDTQILYGGGIYGCDSIIIIDLHFSTPDIVTLDTFLCENERLIVGGEEFSNKGHYVGIIKKENLCDSIWYDITIHKPSKEDINIYWTGPLCIGDTAIIGIENIYESVTWSTGETSDQISVMLPGEYSVSVTDGNGCLNDTTILIRYEEQVSISGDFYYKGHINEPIQFNLFFDGKLNSIIWYPSHGLNCDTCLAPIATLLNSQSYNYIVINEEGCIDTGIVIVEILLDLDEDIYIPNIFNPGSQSGDNRIFQIFTKGNSRKYDLSVFDRWGGLVFHERDLNTNSIDSGWNGKINNTFLPSGVYVYKIVLEDFGTPIIGTITLIQ